MTRLRGHLSPEVRAEDVEVHVRCRAAPPPVPTTEDGRNIDPALGVLSGEASAVPRREPAGDDAPAAARPASAAEARASSASTTYYEQPLLKAPVWKASIPTYFFVGGLAGGCMVLGAAAQLVAGRRLRALVVPARLLATAGALASAGLLIADLGRPARFLNMLRVFRPTSPMNVGTWILSGAGAAAAGSVALPRFGARKLGEASGVVAGVFGLGLTSYTAVLIVNTAVPAWHHGHRTLPPLFVASSAASAAAALDLVPATRPAPRTLSAFGRVAKTCELLAGLAYERALRRAGPSVVKHLRTGRAGVLLRSSQALTLGSLAASALGARRLSGVLGLGGALALRFAVVDAGRASARDPRATFEPQRARR